MFGWISTFLHWKGISKAPSCTSHSISLCDNGFLQMPTAKLKKTAEKVSHCLVRTQTAAQLSTLKRCSFIQTKSSSIGPKLSIASIDARCHSETWPWRFTNFPPFCNSKGTALPSALSDWRFTDSSGQNPHMSYLFWCRPFYFRFMAATWKIGEERNVE